VRPVSSILILLAALCAVAPAEATASRQLAARVERRMIARTLLAERKAPLTEPNRTSAPADSFSIALRGEQPSHTAAQPAQLPHFNRPPPAR
jgi:hypothetical protein